MRARHRWLVASAGAAGVFVLASGGDAARVAVGSCPSGKTPSYPSLAPALAAGEDLWGERLLRAPNGPTLAAARRYLPPLRDAVGRGRRLLSRSGAYYLAFGMPRSLYGDKAFALHVADGSEIITRRVGGRSLSILVGRRGHEVFGSCPARLEPARLEQGYLPILHTSYVDALGVRYRQESFAGRVPQVRSLVSFVKLVIDARQARSTAIVRLSPSVTGLTGTDHALVEGDDTYLVTDTGDTRDGRITMPVAPHTTAEIRLAWIHQPTAAGLFEPNEKTYNAARAAVAHFWEAELDRAAMLDVPDLPVQNAERNLLVQQLLHTWRYSIGNPYEELSFAEALDSAQVMTAYGYGDVGRAIVRFSLKRLPVRYTNWRAGSILLSTATYDQLRHDAAFVDEVTPQLARVVARLGRQLARPGSHDLLPREQFSTDVARRVRALHGQAVVWEGLEGMARTWKRAGELGLASRASALAVRLERGLRRAIASSRRRLPDGSLFLPAALLDGDEPYDRVSATRQGSYWNLVIPYALASGLIPPRSTDAQDTFEYLAHHGAWLLGLVRTTAGTLYGTARSTAGTDEVYGLELSRFLADNDQSDRLVLSLYGMLAAAMTPHTFVSGEAASLTPLGAQGTRAMYLPPNAGTNAAFLETLRLLLVHETRSADGAPLGLELAAATPRAWLAPGKRIAVRDAPTSFGTVSFSLQRRRNTIRIVVDPPSHSPRRLMLRLRLPGGNRAVRVHAGSRRVELSADTGDVDLTAFHHRVTLVATVGRSS